MNKIKLLNEDTIQKIAAGEVIEKPALIVKELVENSIDAKSTNITVEIKKGGKTFIKVSDNGSGIEESDIELAFKRHSTSKLTNFEDLYSIYSLGFRGEALASILSIAKIKIMSKTEESKSGTMAIFEDGKIIEKKSFGMNTGTTISVQDIFYNVPVRKKFLKSDITEGNSITNLMYKLAIGNPGIGIKYIKDSKVIFETNEKNSLRENLFTLFGNELVENLEEFNIKNNLYNIYGYVSNNLYYRANRHLEYLYVNGRYVLNDFIRDSIEESYKHIIPNGRFPVYFLFIKINPSLIDVNIHPNKEKIKFVEKDSLINFLILNIEKAILKTKSIPTIKPLIRENKSEDKKPVLYKNLYSLSEYENKKNIHEDNNDEKYFKDLFSEVKNQSITTKEDVFNDLSFEKINLFDEVKEDLKDGFTLKENSEKYDIPKIEDLRFLSIIFKTYILCEDTKKNQFLIIDQHAAHERVMFEKYMKEYNDNKVVIQNLIVPYILDLNNVEFSVYLKNQDAFKKMGFLIDTFGENSLAIRGVPIIFGKSLELAYIKNIIDLLSIEKSVSEDKYKEHIITMSCKSAVKAGDILSEKEVEELLKSLFACEYPYTCSHGRPFIIIYTKSDLEKSFMRIK